MPEVKITLKRVEDLKLASKIIKVKDEPDTHVVQVSFLTQIKPVDVARLLHQMYSGHPLEVIISSPQAMFDLRLEDLTLETGELAKV